MFAEMLPLLSCISKKLTKGGNEPFSASVQAISSDPADITRNKIHEILGMNKTREWLKYASKYCM